MGITDNRRLGDLRMGDEGAFHFRRSHSMSGYVDNVVNAARDLIVAVLVSSCTVSCRVVARELLEVGFLEALGIAVNAAHEARPGFLDDERAAGDDFIELLALIVDEGRPDTRVRQGRHAGFDRNRAGERRDQDSARLGLPPGIHDGTFTAADDVVIPVPGFRVDGLAHGAEDSQGRDIRLLDPLVAFLGNGADGRGGGVEDVDLVFFHDLPEAADVWVVGHALEHDRRSAVAKGAVDDVGVACDPADVGGAPEDVVFFVIKDHFVGISDEHEVTARGVHDSLGFPRGA